jgi:hypothetical protein
MTPYRLVVFAAKQGSGEWQAEKTEIRNWASIARCQAIAQTSRPLESGAVLTGHGI